MAHTLTEGMAAKKGKILHRSPVKEEIRKEDEKSLRVLLLTGEHFLLDIILNTQRQRERLVKSIYIKNAG